MKYICKKDCDTLKQGDVVDITYRTVAVARKVAGTDEEKRVETVVPAKDKDEYFLQYLDDAVDVDITLTISTRKTISLVGHENEDIAVVAMNQTSLPVDDEKYKDWTIEDFFVEEAYPL